MARRALLKQLNRRIIKCDHCSRLREHCQDVFRFRPARYRDQAYWTRPVPNFLPATDASKPRLLIVGLAPAAHGANRTGRMFTGDRSGDFLYQALFETSFASQATSVGRFDGLKLVDAVITSAIHCAPPANKPNLDELAACEIFLDQTIDAMSNLRVIVCLGQIAHDAVLKLYKNRSWIKKRSSYPFAHGSVQFAERNRTPFVIVCSYHPSQQNTFTGRLTPHMIRQVFVDARRFVDAK